LVKGGDVRTGAPPLPCLSISFFFVLSRSSPPASARRVQANFKSVERGGKIHGKASIDGAPLFPFIGTWTFLPPLPFPFPPPFSPPFLLAGSGSHQRITKSGEVRAHPTPLLPPPPRRFPPLFPFPSSLPCLPPASGGRHSDADGHGERSFSFPPVSFFPSFFSFPFLDGGHGVQTLRPHVGAVGRLLLPWGTFSFFFFPPPFLCLWRSRPSTAVRHEKPTLGPATCSGTMPFPFFFSSPPKFFFSSPPIFSSPPCVPLPRTRQLQVRVVRLQAPVPPPSSYTIFSFFFLSPPPLPLPLPSLTGRGLVVRANPKGVFLPRVPSLPLFPRPVSPPFSLGARGDLPRQDPGRPPGPGPRLLPPLVRFFFSPPFPPFPPLALFFFGRSQPFSDPPV